MLCAAAGGGCDHLDCRYGPFLVVLVGTDYEGQTFSRVYSSETDEWSTPIYAELPSDIDTCCYFEQGRCLGSTYQMQPPLIKLC